MSRPKESAFVFSSDSTKEDVDSASPEGKLRFAQMFPGRGYATIRRSTSLRESLFFLGVIIFAIFAVVQGGAWAAPSERPLRNANAKQLWVGAYVPGWNQQHLDPRNDHLLDAITYFLHFAVYVRPSDGGLDLQTNELTPSKMRALVRAAHRSGKQAFLVVGGEGAAPGLRIASSPERLPNTLKSILCLMDRYGYDGIDVDWEPIAPQDAHLYGSFIESLRKSLDETALHHRRPKLGLTTAIEVNLNNDDYMASLVKTLQKLDEKFDRINLMTYAMANSSNLPFVWHNSALYPAVSPEDGFRTPSADGAIRQFFAAGFQPGKLGIGIDLYGYLWQGQGIEDISSPGKLWKLPPKVVELTYSEVVEHYLKNNPTRWDQQAEVPYLSIPQTNQFLSYEDSRGIEAKLRYVQQNGLGGVIIWDIGRDDQGENAKRQLLGVINSAVLLGKLPESGEIIPHW